jgi:hypothetical protein
VTGDRDVSLDLLVGNPDAIDDLNDAQTWAAFNKTLLVVPRLWRKLLDVKPQAAVSEDSEMMSLGEVAEIVHLHPATVRRTWRREGMPLFAHHNRLVCLRGALNQWLKQQSDRGARGRRHLAMVAALAIVHHVLMAQIWRAL